MSASNQYNSSVTDLTIRDQLNGNFANFSNLHCCYTSNCSNVIHLDWYNNTHWQFILDSHTQYASDLVILSKNNTRITFTDEFTGDILSFTGSHKCSFLDDIEQMVVGKIVIATGEYRNLNNQPLIEIDDSIPVVQLCDSFHDKRVFGVISSIENIPSTTREYKIGNLSFQRDKKLDDIKVVVNSAGEGAIIVCNLNGNLENGDLITTGIDGYGIKQNCDVFKNYTVAKITCDLNFDLNSKIYKCEEFLYDGKTYRKALVGCVYR